MIFDAFGDSKDIMEWLEDVRIHPEITRDVLSKRIRRGMESQTALTKPVIKGAAIGDTKKRISAREEKTLHRVKMFKLAQKVRMQYEKGIAIEELMDRFGLSKSQVNKIAGKQEWYNCHWRGNKIPDGYETLAEKVKDYGYNTDPVQTEE